MPSRVPETNCVESAREWHVMVPTVYISFLVRLWREPGLLPRERPTAWQGEIEHIQSGWRSTFDNLDDLLDFLRRQVTDLDNGRPADQWNGRQCGVSTNAVPSDVRGRSLQNRVPDRLLRED